MSCMESDLINLNGNVTGVLPIANGGTNSSTGTSPERVYIDFINGSDTTGTGSFFAPWKTLQHAYDNSSPTINVPYVFYLSGGNNDTDVGTITGKPNVALFSEVPIQVSAPLTISGGSQNDGISFINIIFIGAVTWIRNDATAMGVFMNGAEFFSGPVFKQNGAGSVSVTAQNCVTVNMDLKTGPVGSFFTGHNFLGTTTFEDANSSAYYQFMGGYTDSAMSIAGGAQAYFSGMQADVGFGYTLTAVTTGNGSPIFQFDSGSVPPTITGTFTQILTSHAQWEAYTPTTSANWNSVPATVLAGLDDLAGSGIVKSQTAKEFLASPNGSAGVPSFRTIVSSDLPTVAIAQGGTGQVTAGAAFAALSPMTTKGDIIYEDATPTPVRLPIGSTGNVLTVSAGGIPSWAASSTATATPSVTGVVTSYFPIVKSGVNSVSSANYVILETDGYSTILVSTGASQRTITLPAVASSAGRILTIKKTDAGAGTVLVSPNSTETIDGAANNTLTAQYSYLTLVSDGTNWYVETAWDKLSATALRNSVNISSGVVTDITSLSVLPGTWQVWGMYDIVTTTSTTQIIIWINSTSASLPGTFTSQGMSYLSLAGGMGNDDQIATITPWNYTITSSTTYYMSARTSNNTSAGGVIWAVRMK